MTDPNDDLTGVAAPGVIGSSAPDEIHCLPPMKVNLDPERTGETLQVTLHLASVHSAGMTERVLVLPRDSVPGGLDFSGVRPADDLAAMRRAVRLHGRYLGRPTAEENPDFKQLIPYVVLRDGASVFLMERTDAGGDARLHGKASIGVGGHLNPVDDGTDPLLAGLRREWAEELLADWEPYFRLVGLLNDDSNPVGAVHLGVVFTVGAASAATPSRRASAVIARRRAPMLASIGACSEDADPPRPVPAYHCG